MALKPMPPGKEEVKQEATNGAVKEKKTRAPRQDYGFKQGAKISLTSKFDVKSYRGKRGEYAAHIANCDGKTVEDFFGMCPDEDPPRGWLRFFVQSGACSLSGGTEQKGEGKAA